MLTDPMFYALAIPAVILLGLAKGGFSGLGNLAVPLMTLAISPVKAAAVLLPILIVQDAVGVWAFRKAWSGQILALMLPGAVAGIGLGYLLAARVSVDSVELAVGVIALVFGLRQLWGSRHSATPKAQASKPMGIFWSVVSGFTSQVCHAGGPPFQVYILPLRLPRDVFIGTSAIFFAAMNWMKVPAYIGLGQFTHETLALTAALLPVAFASTWAGVWLVRKVTSDRFYVLVYALLALLGLKLTWTGLAHLLT